LNVEVAMIIDQTVVNISGNRKGLKCAVCGLSSVVYGLWSVSIDSHIRTYYYVNIVHYYFTK
jgi:hypothetical protein